MEYFDTSCYIFETSEHWQEEAVEYCNEHGLHLVYINSNKEQVYLAERCSNISPDIDYWIGLTVDDDANIAWMDGTVLPYTNWDSDSFDYGSPCINLRSGHYPWHDTDCNNHLSYICEKENVSGIHFFSFITLFLL